MALRMVRSLPHAGRLGHLGWLSALTKPGIEEADEGVRPLHHCHIVNIRGNSYRMRQHTELWQVLHTTESKEAPTSRGSSPRWDIFSRRKWDIFGWR
jgi:hypothetical protein